MPIRSKICGITTPEALDAALAGGASHVGFVFFPKSPRNISLANTQALLKKLPRSVRSVALVVDPEAEFIDTIVRDLPGLTALQFHGDEPPSHLAALRGQGLEIWKAVPVRTQADLMKSADYKGAADYILYDAKPPKGADLPGGTGQRFDWALLQGVQHPLPWILAGGLDAHNLAEARQVTGADFFDVSSGVESAPGIKDVDKIAAFLKAASNL